MKKCQLKYQVEKSATITTMWHYRHGIYRKEWRKGVSLFCVRKYQFFGKIFLKKNVVEELSLLAKIDDPVVSLFLIRCMMLIFN